MNEELIEKYITGKLSEQEVADIEQKLDSDAAFRAKVEKMKEEILGIESYFLRQQLAKINTDQLTFETESKTNLKTIVAILAGFLLIAFLAWMIWFRAGQTNPNNSNNPIAQFSPDQGLPVPMGKTEDYQFMDGMVDFKSGQYVSAIQKWESLKATGSTSDTLEYYLANALQAADRTEEAAVIYESLLLDSSAFSNKTRYYLALIYLQNDKAAEAEELLMKSDFGPAKKLLESIQK